MNRSVLSASAAPRSIDQSRNIMPITFLENRIIKPSGANPTRTVRLPKGSLDRPIEQVDVSTGRSGPHQLAELNGPVDAQRFGTAVANPLL